MLNSYQPTVMTEPGTMSEHDRRAVDARVAMIAHELSRLMPGSGRGFGRRHRGRRSTPASS